MRSLLRRWTAFFLAVMLTAGFADSYSEQAYAAEMTTSEEAAEAVEITENADSAIEVAELIKENDSVDYDTIDTNDRFALKRLVVTADELQETYGAADIIYYEAYDEYILTFETAEATAYAYDEICEDYGTYHCFADEIIMAEDILMDIPDIEPAECQSWGASYMGLDYLKAAYDSYDIENQVSVAIIDSGILPQYGIFAGRIDMENSYHFYLEDDGIISGDDNITDNMGHGTHVAGIIADMTPDNVSLMVLRCFDNGKTSNLAILTSLQHAIEVRADVVNMSLGWYSASGKFDTENEQSFFYKLDKVIEEALDRDIVVCCAAGNWNTHRDHKDVSDIYPANKKEVITVTEIDSNGKIENSYSCYGDTVDYTAPGTKINSTDIDGYRVRSGTSMAAPHITAAAAYIKMIEPETNIQEVKDRLNQYAVDLGEPGWDQYYGNGYVELTTYFHDMGIKRKDAVATDTDAEPKRDKVLPVLGFQNNVVNKSYDSADFVNALSDNSDGEIIYTTSNKNVATVDKKGVVHIMGAGSCMITAELLETDRFLGTKESFTLNVSKADLTKKKITLSQTVYTYAGKPCKPNVIVSGVSSNHYKVAYSGYNKIGTAAVTVTGIGNYTGTVSFSYRIKPAKASLQSAVNTRKGIKLTWDRVKGAAGYKIYRKTSSSDYKCIATVKGGSIRTYVDAKARGGTRYTYIVKAYNGSVIGTAKNKRSLTRLKTPVVKAADRPSGIKVSWNKIKGATGYRVYRKSGGGKYKLIANVKSSKTAYIDRKAITKTLNKYIIIPYRGKTKAAKSSATRAVRRR